MELNSLTEAGRYFLIISAELLALFVGISFLVALLQEFVSEEKVRGVLTRPGKWLGNILGAGLGALTPFCSCSTIPILVGLLNSGAPFGASMSFLVASPLLNPVLISLLLIMMGWRITVVYIIFTFIAAVVIGVIWEGLGLAADYKMGSLQEACCCCAGAVPIVIPLTNREKVQRAVAQTGVLFRQVLPYLLLGAGIGALIYGFVPQEFIVRVAGPGKPWAIPVAAVVGIPMYIRVETMIPIGSALMAKGMSIGAIMALIIGGAGASIPEVSLLASIFKPRLVVTFVSTILVVAILAGYAFNLVLPGLSG